MASEYGMETLRELQAIIARHAHGGSSRELISGLSFWAAPEPSLPLHCMYEPLLAVVAQGAKHIELADRAFQCRGGQHLVVSIDLPVASHVTEASHGEPYLSVSFALRPQLIASVLLEAGPDNATNTQALGLRVTNTPPELLEVALRLLRLLDRPSDIPILQPMTERELIWRLLCSDQGGTVRQIGLADSRLSKISHATRWIREHYAETLRIEDLAERAVMSPTSVHRHFRAATSMSPLQYQKQIRLLEARSRLMARDDDVASVGFSVGYDSPSQFSREYARFFGAPPGRDAASLRAALSS